MLQHKKRWRQGTVLRLPGDVEPSPVSLHLSYFVDFSRQMIIDNLLDPFYTIMYRITRCSICRITSTDGI